MKLKEKFKEVLGLYAAKDDWRPSLMAPFVQDGYVYATDAMILIRFPDKYISCEFKEEAKPNCAALFEFKDNHACTVFISDLEALINNPNIPIIEEKKPNGIDIKCVGCNGYGEVFWKYKRKIKDPDHIINISKVGFKLKYIEILLKTLQLLEVRWCEWIVREPRTRNVFKINDITVIIMPHLLDDDE